MPSDLLTTWQASITKTAAFNGTALTFPTGTPTLGLLVRVAYSAASTSSGAGSAVFAIQVSEDGGSTFNTIAEAEPLVLSTTAIAGEQFIRFSHRPVHFPANLPQYRLSLLSITGTGATVTYQGDTVSGGETP